MLELYQSHREGDGFVALKTMVGNQVEKYDIMRLKTREIWPLAVSDKCIKPDFQEAFQIGPYHFRRDTMERIVVELREMMLQRIQPLFLDEIGELELSGSGYALILHEMIESGLTIYVSVREDLAERVITRFGIGEHQFHRIG